MPIPLTNGFAMTPDPRAVRAALLRKKAEEEAMMLEREAAPPPAPEGMKQNLLHGVLQGLRANAYPGGYGQMKELDQETERTRQADLFSRAKAVRDRGLVEHKIAGDEMGLDLERVKMAMQGAENTSQAAYRQAQINHLNKPEKDEFTDAPNIGVYNKRTGEVTHPIDPNKKDPKYVDRLDAQSGHMIRDFYHEIDPATRAPKIIGSTDMGPAGSSRTARPGSFQFLPDPAGNIFYRGDTETGDITPLTPPKAPQGATGGPRRSPLPDAAQQKFASFDATDAIIADVKKYSDKIHTGEGLTARVGGIIRGGQAYAGYDADVTSLKSKAGELAQIIRAMGESGALSSGDVTRGEQLLPISPRLTKTEATNMLADLSELVKKGRENYKKLYGTQSSSIDDEILNALEGLK